jgi:hypothetical protein
MSELSNYCKAYSANDLRKYPQWRERISPALIRLEAGAENEKGSEYFFIHDDYVVRSGVYLEENVVFDDVTPSWKAFCETALNFRPSSVD